MANAILVQAQEDRLFDYTRERANSPCTSPTSIAADLDEGAESQQQDKMEPNNHGISCPTKKLHEAISTTEFLLNLPLDEVENAANQDDIDSCCSSLSSLGSGFFVGDFDMETEDPEVLSCSDKLRLSLRGMVKQNSGKDTQFSSRGSIKSAKSTGNIKDVADIAEFCATDDKRFSVRRSSSMDSAVSNSTRSLLSLMDDLDSDDPLSEWAQRSTASINFPLRRTLSNGTRFERTPSQRSLASTDRLRRSLSNTMTVGGQERQLSETGDKDGMGASNNGGMGTSSRNSHSDRLGGFKTRSQRTRSAGAAKTTAEVRRRSSFRPQGTRSSHTLQDDRPSDHSVSTAHQSISTAIGSNPTVGSEAGRGEDTSVSPIPCPRKARRRKSRNNLLLDENGQVCSSNTRSRSTHRSPPPATTTRSPPRPNNGELVSPTRRCFIKRTMSKEEVHEAQVGLLSSLANPNFRRCLSDPNRYLQEVKQRDEDNKSDDNNSVSVRRRPRKQISDASDTSGRSLSPIPGPRRAPERRGVSSAKSLNANILRRMGSTGSARGAPEKRGVSSSQSLNLRQLSRMTSRSGGNTTGLRRSSSSVGAHLNLESDKLLRESMSKPSLSPQRRISRAKRLSIKLKQDEEERRKSELQDPASPGSSISSKSTTSRSRRSSCKLAQLAALNRSTNSTASLSSTNLSPTRFSRTETVDSIRSFKQSSRSIRLSGTNGSSNDLLAFAMASTAGLTASGGLTGSKSQAMMPGVARVISSGSLKGRLGEPSSGTGKNAQWSSQTEPKRPAVNPFLSIVDKTQGAAPGKHKPTKVRSLLLDDSSRRKRGSRRGMENNSNRSGSKRRSGTDESINRSGGRRDPNESISHMDENNKSMDGSHQRMDGSGRRSPRRRHTEGIRTTMDASSRRNARRRHTDGNPMSSCRSIGRPSAQETPSQKDLVSQLNEATPRKNLVRDNIKSIPSLSPLKGRSTSSGSKSKIQRKSSNLGKSESGLAGGFITGSRIRRYDTVEEVKPAFN